jgi:mono/diheme cytochrome c family protein
LRSLLLLLPLLFFIVACNGSTSDTPAPTLDPITAEGRRVFQQNCGSCHSADPETVIVGPSLAGIATHAAGRVAGLDARQYIEQSILTPDAYVVEGYTDLMPKDFGRKLSGEELDALITYLLTLEE